jgi:thimet oligopeptidase
MKRIPKTKEDFVWVNWSPADIEKATEKMIARKKERYALIKSIPADQRTFENTIYSIESSDYGSPTSAIYLLMNVSPDADVRKAAEQAINKIQEKYVDIEYDQGLYLAVKDFSVTPEAKQLTGPDKKLFEDMLRDYRRMGFELPEEIIEKLKSNLKELQKFETEFTLNINKDDSYILANQEELAGLPENYISSLKKDESGKYRVSVKLSERATFLENASNAEKRKELVAKYFQVAGQANIDLLKKILDLRQKNSEILGYANYVDYVTETRMAKNAKTVGDFLGDLIKKIEPQKKRDLETLTALKRAMLGEPSVSIEYHDLLYYSKQLEKKLFSIEKEKIREYFPTELVLKGFFEIFGKLFSIEFEELSGYSVWHPDVKFFAVKESSNHEPIAYFYLDLYPRENKYSHAAHFDIAGGRSLSYGSEEYIMPMGAIVTNFPKPSDKVPSLLSHGSKGEVETIFHEMGHLLHDLLTKASYRSQSGTSVAWDFVETPSQILENWVWDKEMVKLISGHYLDHNQKLPPEILDNMFRGKKHMNSWINMRQLFLGMYNHIIHSGPLGNDPVIVADDLHKKLIGIPMPQGNLFPSGFGHLVGYGGAYYSYMWSGVYEADMFTRFKKEGLMNPAIGKEYRDKVLAVGSSRDEMETVKDFLGRETNNQAFLEELGIKE